METFKSSFHAWTDSVCVVHVTICNEKEKVVRDSQLYNLSHRLRFIGEISKDRIFLSLRLERGK